VRVLEDQVEFRVFKEILGPADQVEFKDLEEIQDHRAHQDPDWDLI
jgi:hypothetical protein